MAPLCSCAHQSSSSAANKLRQLLAKARDDSTKDLPLQIDPIQQNEEPNLDEIICLLQHHGAYSHQLEMENRYLMEELSVLKMKTVEVVEENYGLHAELKTTIHEVLKEDQLVKGMDELGVSATEHLADGISKLDYKQWQVELERLKSLHTANCERLEAQLTHSKSEVSRLEQLVTDLRSQLHVHETNGACDVNLCSANISFPMNTNLHNTIDRLSRERDELSERLLALSSHNHCLTQRVDDLCQQIKSSITLVEQAQLEQTEAMVCKAQLEDELEQMNIRFAKYMHRSQDIIHQERASVRQENHLIVDDLNSQLTDCTSRWTLVSEKLEAQVKANAELSTLIAELKGQLRTNDRENTIAAESYRSHATMAILQRASAAKCLDDVRAELQQMRREKDEAEKITKMEIETLTRRLRTAEHGLIEAKEEILILINNASNLERELHLAKLTREGLEQDQMNDQMLLIQQVKERERKLKASLEETDENHCRKAQEMDGMLMRQSKLISLLREECKRQAGLAKITKKFRSQNAKLLHDVTRKDLRLEKNASRIQQLEEQTEQYGTIHNKLISRLKEIDSHSQDQTTQMVKVSTLNNRLTRDRQHLAKEVEFLRRQLASADKWEMLLCDFSCKSVVDDVINAVTEEERHGQPITANFYADCGTGGQV